MHALVVVTAMLPGHVEHKQLRCLCRQRRLTSRTAMIQGCSRQNECVEGGAKGRSDGEHDWNCTPGVQAPRKNMA